MSYDPAIADRVRRVLADRAGVAAGWVWRGLDFAAGLPAKPDR